MNFLIDCKCEPCLLDIGEYGFKVEWEDQAFVGKKCLWHKHIISDKGCISPDTLDGKPAVFVQLHKQKFTIPTSDIGMWEGDRLVELMTFDEETKRCVVVLVDAFFTVPVSELRRWAKFIGAKRK